MESSNEPIATAQIEGQSEPDKPKRKTPGVVIAHRVLSSLAICFGLMWILIGVSLMQQSPPSTPSFSSGPGSQRQTYYHSSERDKAPAYVAFGAIWAAVFVIGLFLRAGPFAYIYHTILLVPFVGLLVGLILCIWWFRKRTRNYYGIGASPNA